MNTMKVLGLHGRMGAGKNYIAEKIATGALSRADYMHHARSIAFADPLKEAVHVLFDVPLKDLYSQEGKARLTDWRWEDLGTLRAQFPDRTGFMTVRDILQLFGTETMRALWGRDFWARLMRKTLKRFQAEGGYRLVIITDVRYPEEADVIRALGGEIWKIVPVDMPLDVILSSKTVEAHREHSSENELHKTLIAATVYNSFRDFAATEARIKPLLAKFMTGFPWPEAHSAYENAGPEEELTFEKAGHTFLVSPTGDCGFDTGRKRYLVKCLSCNKVLHENTTGPGCLIREHLDPMFPLKQDAK